MSARDLLPTDSDLPGVGWLAIDEGFDAPGDAGSGVLFDCVGSGFPDSAVLASASSPHFLRPPGTLVHGIAVDFDTTEAADRAASILGDEAFAACLGRAIAADIDAASESGATRAEVLTVEVTATDHGHRVTFTGGDEHGVRPVNLDIATLRHGRGVAVLWCGDTPEHFADADLDHLLACIHARTGA